MAVITFLLPKSALPAVDEPFVNVPFSPRYYYFCVAVHVASLLTAASPKDDSIVVQYSSFVWYYTCSNAMPTGSMFAIIAFL